MVDDCGCGEFLRGPDVKQGIAWVGRKLKPLMFTVVDGDDAVVEGCIILGSAALLESRIAQFGLQSFGVGVAPEFLWPNKRVVYRIASDLPDQLRVRDAVAHWQEHVTLEFVERTAGNQHLFPNFVTFRTGTGCSSAVGCQRGEQFIKLSAACSTGNVIHEIGHAVGLFHEQSREDRDLHVDVIFDNIEPLYRHNFTQKIKEGQDIGVYDFASIMHYPADAFSRNGNPTIRSKSGKTFGQRERLSAGDIATVEALYA